MKKRLITTCALLFFAVISGGLYSAALSGNISLERVSKENIKQNVIIAAAQTKTTPQSASSKTQSAQSPQTAQIKPVNTTSLAIVASPEKFLNKTVKMQATFDKFSTLGLDYSKALRKSTDYIGILIQRDDVIDHNIPLSEMKLFLTKETAEKHIDLDTGDKIEITANVFSTALGDPWLDVKDLKVIAKAKKDEEKDNS